MDERIHTYFHGALSKEDRLRLLREVEANDELRKEFAEYQNLYALLNLGYQVQDKALGKKRYEQFMAERRKFILRKRLVWTARYAAAALVLIVSSCLFTYWRLQAGQSVPEPKRSHCTRRRGNGQNWFCPMARRYG